MVDNLVEIPVSDSAHHKITPQNILRFQHTIGNQAVQRLLLKQQLKSTIQRSGKGPTGAVLDSLIKDKDEEPDEDTSDPEPTPIPETVTPSPTVPPKKKKKKKKKPAQTPTVEVVSQASEVVEGPPPVSKPVAPPPKATPPTPLDKFVTATLSKGGSEEMAREVFLGAGPASAATIRDYLLTLAAEKQTFARQVLTATTFKLKETKAIIECLDTMSSTDIAQAQKACEKANYNVKRSVYLFPFALNETNLEAASQAYIKASNVVEKAEYYRPYILNGALSTLSDEALVLAKNKLPLATEYMGFLAPLVNKAAILEVAKTQLKTQPSLSAAKINFEKLKNYNYDQSLLDFGATKAEEEADKEVTDKVNAIQNAYSAEVTAVKGTKKPQPSKAKLGLDKAAELGKKPGLIASKQENWEKNIFLQLSTHFTKTELTGFYDDPTFTVLQTYTANFTGARLKELYNSLGKASFVKLLKTQDAAALKQFETTITVPKMAELFTLAGVDRFNSLKLVQNTPVIKVLLDTLSVTNLLELLKLATLSEVNGWMPYITGDTPELTLEKLKQLLGVANTTTLLELLPFTKGAGRVATPDDLIQLIGFTTNKGQTLRTILPLLQPPTPAGTLVELKKLLPLTTDNGATLSTVFPHLRATPGGASAVTLMQQVTEILKLNYSYYTNLTDLLALINGPTRVGTLANLLILLPATTNKGATLRQVMPLIHPTNMPAIDLADLVRVSPDNGLCLINLLPIPGANYATLMALLPVVPPPTIRALLQKTANLAPLLPSGPTVNLITALFRRATTPLFEGPVSALSDVNCKWARIDHLLQRHSFEYFDFGDIKHDNTLWPPGITPGQLNDYLREALKECKSQGFSFTNGATKLVDLSNGMRVKLGAQNWQNMGGLGITQFHPMPGYGAINFSQTEMEKINNLL